MSGAEEPRTPPPAPSSRTPSAPRRTPVGNLRITFGRQAAQIQVYAGDRAGDVALRAHLLLVDPEPLFVDWKSFLYHVSEAPWQPPPQPALNLVDPNGTLIDNDERFYTSSEVEGAIFQLFLGNNS
ncbi:unnamed protein product [Symbiodinium sp. CCMP2592]|nr:unnamed protein product [Symbiodinium sp. CCMP2592]